MEDNNLVKRTLEYYAGILFNSRQSTQETVAEWSLRLDKIEVDLRREVRNRFGKIEDSDGWFYVESCLILLREILKGTFISGLEDDPIKYIVKTKSKKVSLAHLIKTAIQEGCGSNH